MNSKKSQRSSAGWVIPLCQNNPGRNLIVPSQADEVIRAVNAIGKLEVVYDEVATEPRVVFSDAKMMVLIPRPASSSTTTTSGLPWQITLQDTADGRTFQVGAGYAYAATKAGLTYSSQYVYEPIGHNTNITVPDGESYLVWLRCSAAGAEIQHGLVADLPADWPTYPAIQGLDAWWNTNPYGYGYVLIGIVSALNPTSVIQYLTHNPQINVAAKEEVTFQGNWTASTPYRLNAIVRYSGATYIRTNILLGIDGGTPGSADWTAI